MADYISREAVLQKFLERGSGYINELTMRDMINEISAADVQPVKRGKWINAGDFEECSECHATRLKEFRSYYGKVTRWEKSNYCPNCGARMDGEHE